MSFLRAVSNFAVRAQALVPHPLSGSIRYYVGSIRYSAGICINCEPKSLRSSLSKCTRPSNEFSQAQTEASTAKLCSTLNSVQTTTHPVDFLIESAVLEN